MRTVLPPSVKNSFTTPSNSTTTTTEPPIGAVVVGKGDSGGDFPLPMVLGLIFGGLFIGILVVLIFILGVIKCTSGNKVILAEDSGDPTAAYSNVIYEDIPSRPPSVYPPEKIPHVVKPLGARNSYGKHVQFEKGNPTYESDFEDEELEGAVGGVPLPAQPPPYSEKDVQMAHIMSHVRDVDDEKKKVPVFDEDDDGYLEAPIAQVVTEDGELPEKPPIDVLY